MINEDLEDICMCEGRSYTSFITGLSEPNDEELNPECPLHGTDEDEPYSVFTDPDVDLAYWAD